MSTAQPLAPEAITLRIATVRGARVILDADLAALYEVETKRFNEAVRRNLLKFPADFMFQLAADEWAALRSQIATLNTGGRGRHRKYLPYAFTLKQFRHDVYPGTDIPKNFSSLVQEVNPSRSESREVLIYMNQPLRYEGKAFYQASFGKGDTLSVLQVVENPGWLLPYISCTFR